MQYNNLCTFSTFKKSGRENQSNDMEYLQGKDEEDIVYVACFLS